MATKNAFYSKFGKALIRACWEGKLPAPPEGFEFEAKPVNTPTPYGFSVDCYEITVTTPTGGSILHMFEGQKYTPRSLAWGEVSKELLEDLTEIRRSAADNIRQKYRLNEAGEGVPVSTGGTTMKNPTIDLAALASMSDEEKLAMLNSMVTKAEEEKAAKRAALEEKARKLREQLAAVEAELAKLD